MLNYFESIAKLNNYICAILAKSVHLKIDKLIFEVLFVTLPLPYTFCENGPYNFSTWNVRLIRRFITEYN